MKAPKKKVQKVKKATAPKVRKKTLVKKSAKKNSTKTKNAKKKPAKRKMAYDILSPANYKRLQKVTVNFTQMALWFITQQQDFDKVAERLEGLSDTFRHRLLTQPDREANLRELKLSEKFDQVDKCMVEVISDFSDYVDRVEETDKKGWVLMKRILDEKKQDQASLEITKLAQLFAPLIGQVDKLKERCDSIPVMLDDIEVDLKRDVN